jgi:hypothetical protein
MFTAHSYHTCGDYEDEDAITEVCPSRNQASKQEVPLWGHNTAKSALLWEIRTARRWVFSVGRRLETCQYFFCHKNKIDCKLREISLSACKNQVAIYQLNMFGVAVLGSIPRWTSLYRTESKYPAKPAKMKRAKTTISKRTSVPVLK